MSPEHKYYFFVLLSAIYLSRSTPRWLCWVVGVGCLIYGSFVRDGV